MEGLGLLTVTSGRFFEATGIHICTDHTGKMKLLWSMSTSPENEICKKRAQIPGSICAECYSVAMNSQYSDLAKCLKRNASVLNERVLEDDELPRLSNKLRMFRFESFGDLTSEIQVVNYFKIAEANPGTDCALWTKNPWFIERAMKNYGISKPANLTIIGSSYFVNAPMIEFYKKYDFIDYIFTVYDKDYIKENNVEINCGGRSCRTCQRCYKGTHNGYEIREQLK